MSYDDETSGVWPSQQDQAEAIRLRLRDEFVRTGRIGDFDALEAHVAATYTPIQWAPYVEAPVLTAAERQAQEAAITAASAERDAAIRKGARNQQLRQIAYFTRWLIVLTGIVTGVVVGLTYLSHIPPTGLNVYCSAGQHEHSRDLTANKTLVWCTGGNG